MLWNVTDHTLRLQLTTVEDWIYRTLKFHITEMQQKKKKRKKTHTHTHWTYHSRVTVACMTALPTKIKSNQRVTSDRSSSSIVWPKTLHTKMSILGASVSEDTKDDTYEWCWRPCNHSKDGFPRGKQTCPLHDFSIKTCPAVGLWWPWHHRLTAGMTGRVKSHVCPPETPQCLCWSWFKVNDVQSIYC